LCAGASLSASPPVSSLKPSRDLPPCKAAPKPEAGIQDPFQHTAGDYIQQPPVAACSRLAAGADCACNPADPCSSLPCSLLVLPPPSPPPLAQTSRKLLR
jgi:hypothetical protein